MMNVSPSKCYVALAMTVCLLAGGLAVLFLIARDITISNTSPHLNSTSVVIDEEDKTVRLHVHVSSVELFLETRDVKFTIQIGSDWHKWDQS